MREVVLFLCLCCSTALAQNTILVNLVPNGSLVFNPLPSNRRVEVEIDDNSNGLQPWANLANAFVDSVRSGSLPYDEILPYLNNSLDNLLSEQGCATTKTNSGGGNSDIGDLLREFATWWAPILVVTVLGPVFAVIFLLTGCIFGCCRLCGNCGGDLQQEHRETNDRRCLFLYLLVICCICLLFIGVVFAFVSNEDVNRSIRDFDNTVTTALNNSLRFVYDTQDEANLIVAQYDEVNRLVQQEINNTHLSIGGVVIDEFDDFVNPLITSSLQLATDVNTSIDSLQQVDSTVLQLQTLTSDLDTQLMALQTNLTSLNTDCVTAFGNISPCTNIPLGPFSVTVDYSIVQNVTEVLRRLQNIGNIEQLAVEANNTFYGIPLEIRDQIINNTADILRQASSFREDITDVINEIEEVLDDIFSEDGFVGDVRTRSGELQDTLDEYDTPRYAVSIVLCSLTLVVILVLVVGLLLGTIGFRRNEEPPDRTTVSTWGGHFLMIGVGLMFFFAIVLLFLASITFFMGSNMLKVCYSIAEDPPNDARSYELFEMVVDNRELWGGYLLGCFIVENSSVPLTVASILNGCRDNQPLYEVTRLRLRPNLNLENVTNITNQLPDFSRSFMDLEQDITFDPDQILTADTRQSLTDFSTSGVDSINYTAYFIVLEAQITSLNISSIVIELTQLRDNFTLAGQNALETSTQTIIVGVGEINNTLNQMLVLTDTLETEVTTLVDIATNLNMTVTSTLSDAERLSDELVGSTGTELVINESMTVLDRIIAFADDYARWAVDNLENNIGRCQPLYGTYSNLYHEVCETVVDGINGFWLAIGWCVLFFIPTIFFAVWLSHYFRRMNEPESAVEPYDLDNRTATSTSYQMKNMNT